jgi:hypothetical protein
LRKATISFVMPVRPSVCLHGKTRFPLDGFSWKNFSKKRSRENSGFIKTWLEYWALYLKSSIHFWSYLAHLFLEWEMFQTKVVEKIKTHFVWCGFDRASSIKCGNKMPTRCSRWIFYCRFYCLLNMFRAPLCSSSGAIEYYTSGCCLSYLVLGFQVVGTVWSWGLCVRFAGCFLFSRPEPLLFYSSSSSVDLTRLSGPRSRPTTTQKISESNPGPLYV